MPQLVRVLVDRSGSWTAYSQELVPALRTSPVVSRAAVRGGSLEPLRLVPLTDTRSCTNQLSWTWNTPKWTEEADGECIMTWHWPHRAEPNTYSGLGSASKRNTFGELPGR